MNKFLKMLLPAMAAVSVLVSCNDDSDYDRADYYAYVTVNEEDGFYYFTGDDGETYWPGRGYYNPKDKDGKRAYIEFDMLSEKKEDYDYNVALYYVYDILSKEVEVAETEEEVDEAGDGALEVRRIVIEGKWLDITFYLTASNGSTHKMTLLDNRTVDAPADTPEDYQYLEFRQLPEYSNGYYEKYVGKGHVSYDLGDYITDKKGLYIRIRNLDGNVEYLTVEYNAPEESKARGIDSTVYAMTADGIW